MDKPKDEIHRDELYELIWKKPATEIAKRWDISSSMLTRICRELNVPKPRVGYWAKVAHGKKVRKPPLPAKKAGGKEVWQINRAVVRQQKELAHQKRGAPSIGRSPEVEHILSGELIDHKWVKSTRSASKSDYFSREGRVFQQWDRNHFTVTTSKDHLERALAFLNRLIHLAESEGIAIEVQREEKAEENSRWRYREPARPSKVGMFQWEGEQIGLRMFEKFKRTERPHSSGWKEYEYHPTGMLEFTLTDTCGCAGRGCWRDGKRQKIEDFYLQIVATIKEATVGKKEYLIRRKIEAERQKKIEDMQQAIRRQRYREDHAFEKVQKDASLFAEAQRIRAYADAAQSRLAEKRGSEALAPYSDIGLWLQWIRIRADWVDPLSKGTQPWTKVVREVIKLEDRDRFH